MRIKIYDTIIVGLGPAGMSAGIYAARREMKTLIIGKTLGGQMVWASHIANYPGFKNISNVELIQKFKKHVEFLNVSIKEEKVQKIQKSDNTFIIYTNKAKYISKTVIIAMGLMPKRLEIKGEEKLVGKGISYCANCDSPLYRNKDVAIVGGGNSALDAAELLTKIAKKVYLIHSLDEFRGFEALLKEIKKRVNIEIIYNSEPEEIGGKEKVEYIKIYNNKDKKTKKIVVAGVFIEVGRIAHTDLVKDLVKRNDKKQIIIDEKCCCRTQGIFAAGDVTTVPYKQISIAVGQGTIAALAAYEYLQVQQGKNPLTIVDRG